MMVTDHREAHEETVALFKAYAEGGESARIRQFATELLATLLKHLDHVRKLKAQGTLPGRACLLADFAREAADGIQGRGSGTAVDQFHCKSRPWPAGEGASQPRLCLYFVPVMGQSQAPAGVAATQGP